MIIPQYLIKIIQLNFIYLLLQQYIKNRSNNCLFICTCFSSCVQYHRCSSKTLTLFFTIYYWNGGHIYWIKGGGWTFDPGCAYCPMLPYVFSGRMSVHILMSWKFSWVVFRICLLLFCLQIIATLHCLKQRDGVGEGYEVEYCVHLCK